MEDQELEKVVKKFPTYNDYLDSMITKDDLLFLQDKEMCRDLLTLGYHTNKKIISEEGFVQKKLEIAKDVKKMRVKERKLYSEGGVCEEILMKELAKREEDNLTGRVGTIIFLRDLNPKGEEVSAYIDFAHRLATDNWEDFFRGRKKLLPLPIDLSFYNWKKENSCYSSSPNFEVVTDKESLKLYFVCKADGKIIEVQRSGDSYRQDLNETNYLQAVLFDHIMDTVVLLRDDNTVKYVVGKSFKGKILNWRKYFVYANEDSESPSTGTLE